MSTEVERARGLEREGIQTDRVRWNLSAAALYEEAVRRQEGVIAADGPLVVPHRPAHRPLAERQVRRPRAVERGARSRWGKVNRPIDAGAVRRAAPGPARARWRARSSSSSTASRAPIRRIACRSASSTSSPGTTCSAATCSSTIRRRPRRAAPAVHGHRLAELQGRSGAARHAAPRSMIALNFAKKLVLIGGTQLRRRDQEVDLHGAELPAAAAERAVDALLGEHRRGRRHGAVLRPVGHRQDDAVERSGAQADRRRRARLERSRRLQLRRRLLREDDPAVGRGRAADLRDDAALRHGARERRGRSEHTRALDLDDDRYTENTRAAYPIAFIDNAVPSGQGGHPRNVVMLTADAFGVLPPIARLTPEAAMYHFLSGYTAKVAGTEKGVTEPKATFSTCFGAPFLPLDAEPLREDARREDRAARRARLAGQHRLDRRPVRRRHAHEDRATRAR